jgi:hypothetical protein
MKIIVNGQELEYTNEFLTYEDAVELAGWRRYQILSVTVNHPSIHPRILFPNGGFIKPLDGMIVNVADTSNA